MTEKILVKGKGPKRAKFMVIGEAPGAKEAKKGEPFVGKSGHTLDKWLKILGIPREATYITNIIKEYLPKNRNPTPKEVEYYIPELMVEIARVNPSVIITLGKVSTEVLFGHKDKLSEVVGNVRQIRIMGGYRLVMALYHPAFINRSKKELGEDAEEYLNYLKELL